jgi:hypothetical protein
MPCIAKPFGRMIQVAAHVMQIKNIEFTYAAENSMSGQVSVPADLTEMFEVMVESLALGSKAPLHAY